MKLFLPSLFIAGALAALILGLDSGERRADEGRLRLVVTQLPAGFVGGPASSGRSLSSRYPSGSRVVLLEPGAGPDAVVRVLSEGLDAAGAPDLSPLGDRVVFAGRRRPDSRWCIYEVGVERGRPERRVEVAGDCGDPAFLPAGGFVFVVTEDDGVQEDHDSGSRSYLCRTSGTAGGVQRITFGPGACTDPTVLWDGRVLFSMTTDASAAGRGAAELGLYTVNPDGTLLAPFSGVHDGPRAELRARQTEDGRIVFLSGATAETARTLACVSYACPMGARTDLTAAVTDMGAEHRSLPLRVRSAEPCAESGLLVTGRRASFSGQETFGIYLLEEGAERAELLYDDPTWHEVEALPATRSRRPRVRPSSVAADVRTGTLVGHDAGYSDGLHGPAAGAAAPAMLSVQTSSRAAAEAGLEGEWVADTEPGVVELGRVAVASDRSFFIRVPADVPLRVRSFDAEREPIATSGWFWVRPGETRACFGCHERRDTAPPNRILRAIADPPQDLATRRRELAERQ